MKRILAVWMSVLLLLTFSGCAASALGGERSTEEERTVEKDTGPLRICVDLAYLGIENLDPSYSFENAVEGAVQGLMMEVSARGGLQDTEIEVIPREEAARKSALTRLRTEIMSGEGPDVFIMGCAGGLLDSTGDALFAIPEKAMENRLFYPLDEFMENGTQYTEWDKLQQTVLEAGRNADGQLIVPLTYTLPITFYRESDVPEKPGGDTAWSDMREDTTGVLAAAATWDHMPDGLISMRGSYIQYTFGRLADYSAETLTFTEEELVQRVKALHALETRYASGEWGTVPAHYQTCLSVDFNNATGTNFLFALDPAPFGGIRPDEAQTMIPIYCEDGGTTAAVISYAAINANTRRPADAFFVLDVLLDRKTQQTSVLYENWFTSVYGIPMHTDLLQPKHPAMYAAKGKMWYLTEENYTELRRVCDQITCARFRSGIDEELNRAYYAYVNAVQNGGDPEAVLSESYGRIKRLLSE